LPDYPFRKFAFVNQRLVVGDQIVSRSDEDYHHFDLIREAADVDEIDLERCAAGWIIGQGSTLHYTFGPFTGETSPIAEAEQALAGWAGKHGVVLRPVEIEEAS